MSNTFKQPQYRDATMSLNNTFSKSTFKIVGDLDTADALCIGLWGDSVGNNSHGYIQTIIDAPGTSSQAWPLLLNPNGGAVGINNITGQLANLHITGGVQNNSNESDIKNPTNGSSANAVFMDKTRPSVLYVDATNQSLGNTKGNFMPIFMSRSYIDNINYLNIYNYRHTDGISFDTACTRIQQSGGIDNNMSYIEFNPPSGNSTSPYNIHGGIGIYSGLRNDLNGSVNGITINYQGLVGISTKSPSAYLHLNTTGYTDQTTTIITGQYGAIMPATSWPVGWGGGIRTCDILCASLQLSNGSTLSDIHLKTNIETYKRGLSEVMKLRPVSFIWKDRPTYGMHLGFIAQEIEQIIPELIVENNEGLKNIKEGINAILVNCIQEQQKLIETLQTENKEMRDEISSIIKRISILRG
jgi:hypothetical protein